MSIEAIIRAFVEQSIKNDKIDGKIYDPTPEATFFIGNGIIDHHAQHKRHYYPYTGLNQVSQFFRRIIGIIATVGKGEI